MPCFDESQRADKAFKEYTEAYDDFEHAGDVFLEENDPLDESTWTDAALVSGVAIACVSNPFGWLVCGLGIVGGGAGIVGSEIDRFREIDAAEKAFDKAGRSFYEARREYINARLAEHHCLLHNKLNPK